jgi:hypothetical protein
VSRSGWHLHPCIAEALGGLPHCYVLCDQLPNGFFTVSFESPGAAVLDPASGRIYEIEWKGDLPLNDNRTQPVMSLLLYKQSLEDWLEDWLAFMRCAAGGRARASGGAAGSPLPEAGHVPPTELTPQHLDPACVADPAVVWHELYRGVESLLIR